MAQFCSVAPPFLHCSRGVKPGRQDNADRRWAHPFRWWPCHRARNRHFRVSNRRV